MSGKLLYKLKSLRSGFRKKSRVLDLEVDAGEIRSLLVFTSGLAGCTSPTTEFLR